MTKSGIYPFVIRTSVGLDAPLRFKPRPLVAAIQASIMGLGLACASAQAAEIVVTSNRDDNGEGCTLR